MAAAYCWFMAELQEKHATLELIVAAVLVVVAEVVVVAVVVVVAEVVVVELVVVAVAGETCHFRAHKILGNDLGPGGVALHGWRCVFIPLL